MPTLQFNLEERSPFDRKLRLSKDALLPTLIVQLLDGVNPVDLTSATVTFSMDDEAGTAKVNNASATLKDGATGKIEYAWSGTDTDTAGLFFGQFVVTIGTDTHRVPNNDSQRLIIDVGPRVN